jgi:tetraacyldisaccharide 4'-kinase
VDFRICNGGVLTPGDVPMQLQGGSVRALADGHIKPLTDFAGQVVHAVAAIGHPLRFFASLRSQGLQVIEHAFPDHHAFVVSDLTFADCHPVLMTEKDAVKCVGFAQPHWWAAPVRAVLPPAFFDDLEAHVRKARVPKES